MCANSLSLGVRSVGVLVFLRVGVCMHLSRCVCVSPVCSKVCVSVPSGCVLVLPVYLHIYFLPVCL